MRLSIIIPVLDEGGQIAATLDALADLRTLGTEVVVVDGGSRDATVQRARLRADLVVPAQGSRAAQMNAGAAKANGDVLLFLRADTRLPRAADHLVLDGLARSGRAWGRFDVYIEGNSWRLAPIAWLVNWRSRFTGIATGDQAMFVKREAFEAAGRFQDGPTEDIALSKRLKSVSRPYCVSERVVIPDRRAKHAAKA
jgi:rSAM/selenodomain-associated transferase 2